MSSFGVLDTGFRIKTLQEILAEIEDAQRESFGPAFSTQPDSTAGQLNGIFGDQVAEVWEVLQDVYRSRQPSSANGEALDNVADITGAVRLPASSSTVTLELNLTAGTVVPAGNEVRIGSAGAVWEVLADIENTGSVTANISGSFKSVDTGIIVGNPSTIDTITDPVSGWTAQAAITSLNTETFTLANNETLLVEVDQGSAQIVTFLTADFADITNATAAEVAAKIDSSLTGAGAAAVSTAVRITSDLDGSGSAIRITGGTGAEALGFTQAEFKGFNNDTPAQTLNGNAEPYVLVDGQTLTVVVDGGSTQTVTFNTGDFVSIGAATATEVAKVITTDLTGAVGYEVSGKVQIESLIVGVNSEIEVTGGTANPVLGFQEVAFSGASGQATVGRDIETDAEFRLRRIELLRISGAATLEAVRSAILDTLNVTQAFIFENDTDVVDGNGLPAHSFESVVQDGEDLGVAQTIFDTKPIGIQTFRDPGPDGRTEIITDSQGKSHNINYSRPTAIQMFIEVDIDATQSTFGGGDQTAGETQVKDVLKALGDLQQIGEDVIIAKFLCSPFDVAGVVDVTLMQIEATFPPTNTANIVIAGRDIATFSTADIVVNVTFV